MCVKYGHDAASTTFLVQKYFLHPFREVTDPLGQQQ